MRIATVIVSLLVASGLAAPAADAYVLPPKVEAEFDAIVDYNYRGSAQTSPPTCGAVCQDLRAAETRGGGWSTPQVEQLSRESRTLRVATGLSGAIRLTGGVTLAATAFEVGYRIGSGLNAKFFKVGLPAKSPVQVNAPQRLSFYETCSLSSPCTIGSIYHDQVTITRPAYVWTWDAAWQSPYGANYWNWRSNDGNCSHPMPPPDAPRVFESVASSSTCNGSPNYSGTTTSAWWYQNDLRAATPVEDYVSQPYTYQAWPPSDPGQSTVATRTRDELEDGDYPILRQKIEYELAVPEVCDPVDPDVCNPPETDRDQEKKCDLSNPEDGDPDPLVSTDQFAAGQYVTVNAFTRVPLGGGSPIATSLKVGWTGPSSTSEWKGWGWRHVAAKHGWDSADIAATQAALATTPTLDNGRLIYVGPEYTQNGVTCQRKVVVADSSAPNEPSPKEIITSYGMLISAP